MKIMISRIEEGWRGRDRLIRQLGNFCNSCGNANFLVCKVKLLFYCKGISNSGAEGLLWQELPFQTDKFLMYVVHASVRIFSSQIYQ